MTVALWEGMEKKSIFLFTLCNSSYNTDIFQSEKHK